LFAKSKSAKDGYDPVCKNCRSLIAKQGTVKYRQEHPPEIVRTSIGRISKQKNDIEDEKRATEYENKKCYDVFMKNVFKTPNKKPKQNNTIIDGICPVCRINQVNSKHHIVPREYGGGDDKTNIIQLCNYCHDIVEIGTEDWIKSGKRYSSDILRSMILNNGF
jgi:hypothetical protein